MIVEFENPQQLKAVGNNTYQTDEAPMNAENTVVKQGYLEGSNVQPVLEMTSMIEVSRSYQQVQRTIQSEHERMRNAIQKLLGRG